MVKPTWILVADASQARILQKQSGASFEMVHSFSHPQSRLKASDLGSDSAGREKEVPCGYFWLMTIPTSVWS